MIYVGYHYNIRNTDSYIVCSEKHDDYEILQALRVKIPMEKCDDGKHRMRDLTFEKQIDVEMILHSFGFREESCDNKYNKGDKYQVKCWKFARTVRK
ncbi:hypothetical protein DdX_14378 [Ditylenchus destructor]|uniref:Uncharacterized protein n=1 Tax=Ditylenchus destructor TaxID=166010 RepID=A0AAD4MUC6_9BILA|nr:hypothetical protein DdX_14378 [Ditylenchus destructor]